MKYVPLPFTNRHKINTCTDLKIRGEYIGHIIIQINRINSAECLRDINPRCCSSGTLNIVLDN